MMQADITVVQPGVYQASAAFFGKQRPAFQLFVNGKILRAHSRCMGQHTAARANCSDGPLGQHMNSTSLLEYLVLPADACLTIVSPSQQGLDQGFLSLQRIC